MHNSTFKNHFRLFTLLFAVLFFILQDDQLSAQITIEKDIFTKLIGKKYKEVLYETDDNIDGQLAEIKAAIGPDQVWDFSGFNYIDSTVITYEVMVVDPNDPLLDIEELSSSQYINKITILPGSGGVEDTSTSYLYTSLENDVWTVNGSFTMIDLDLDGVLDSALQYFVPSSVQVPFPVTSTSEWFDSTNLVTVFDGMEFIGSIMIDTTRVQGYGTLITPQGTAEALRVHNKSLNKSPFFPNVDESNDYDFVTADDEISASIVVEDGRAFYSVRTIVDGPSSTIDLNDISFIVNGVSPNPFQNTFDVNLNIKEAGNIEFYLISLDGQVTSLLKKDYLSSGFQNIQLTTENIPRGLYYLQVKSGRFIQHIPVNRI